MANQYTKYGRTRYGPPAMSRRDAFKAGYTEGPYYHSSDAADQIKEKGFRSRGAESWEIRDHGTMEELQKFDSAEPVFFGRNRKETKGYGSRTVEAWARPKKLKDTSGKTLAGGLYASDPADVVPIGRVSRRKVK